MEIWFWFLIIAIISVVVEIYIPTMFCINFAFAGILTAIVSIFWNVGFTRLLIVFAILSLLAIIFVRPMLTKILKKDNVSDFNDQYIGKVVKCIEPITLQSGSVTIYDERWEARLAAEGDEIPFDADVKIIKHDGLILYVEKV
ncbi:NfeD family protein [bacterium]|nr:NfeD family protein [bacterium]